MFQFPGFPAYDYEFIIRFMVIRHEGFPIRKSTDISLICSSPWLIAACHVLRRLLMPRHSPCALFRLNFPRTLSGARSFSELLEFHKQIENSQCKGFPLHLSSTLVENHLCGEIVYPLGKTNSNLLKFVLSNLFVSTLQFALFGFQ